MVEIIPAVIPQNLNFIEEKFSKVLGLVNKIQLDIIDGEYAPSKSWPFKENQFEDVIKIVRGEEKFPFVDNFILEIDMLIKHPIEYISDFISLGARSFVIHIDSTDHVKECIKTIKDAGCNVGLGVRPSGDINLLETFLPEADFVQFMGNDKVGYNGVELDPKVLNKIEKFHNRHPSIPLQIDIGVNRDTINELKNAGISRFVSGSLVFNSNDIRATIINLKKI